MRKGTKSIAIFKGVFTVLLIFPTIWMLLGGGSVLENSEKRDLAEFPTMADSLEAFPKAYEKYFNDRFGGRNELVFATNLFKASVLKSSHTDDVMIGKDGWRFLNKSHMVKDYRGVARLDSFELRAIRYRIELMDSIVKSYGGKFVFVVAPNKQSIYPEHLPWTMQKLNDTTRLDQLAAYMNANSDVTFVNLVPTLLEGKKQGKMYLTTDTHWNQDGAYLGFVSVMKALFGESPAYYDLGEVEMISDSVSGDLNGMLGFAGMFPEWTETFKITRMKGVSFTPEEFGETKYTFAHAPGMHPISVLFYNDSFGANMRNFLFSIFAKSYVLKNNRIDVQFMADLKANVVIFEVVERQLAFFPNCKIIR